MRIIITTLIVVLNFILQTTLFPYLAIQGVFPNTALIIVTSYSLLRGSKEGALVGAGTGFLMDVFFHTYIGFYTALYLLIGLIFGRSQRSFSAKIIFCRLFSARLPQFFIRQCCMFQALCSKEKEIFSISSSTCCCQSWSI